MLTDYFISSKQYPGTFFPCLYLISPPYGKDAFKILTNRYEWIDDFLQINSDARLRDAHIFKRGEFTNKSS